MWQGKPLPTAQTTTLRSHPDSPVAIPGSPATLLRMGPCACASPEVISPASDGLGGRLPFAIDLRGWPGNVPNSLVPGRCLVRLCSAPPMPLDCHECAAGVPTDPASLLGSEAPH